MKNHLPTRPAGFATFITVAMLIFVAMAVMTLTRLTALDVQRTQKAKTDAQQRQLLLAGAAAATATLNQDPHFTGTMTVNLPAELQHADAALTLRITHADDQRSAVVRATIGQKSLQQSINLTPAADHWTAASVTID